MIDNQTALQRAVSLHQTGQLDAAERGYRKILLSTPNNCPALSQLAMLLHQKGQLADSLAVLNRLVTLQPHPGIYMNQCEVLKALGRLAEAASACQSALQLDRNFRAAHGNLAFLFQALGRSEDALKHCRWLVETNPQSVDGHLNLGGVLVASGDLPGAAAAYQRALEVSPNNPVANINLANVLIALKEFPRAIGCLKAAWELQGRDTKTLIDLVDTLKKAGNLQEADALISQARKQKTMDPIENFNLGILLGKQGLLDAAVDRLKAALEINPNFNEARESLIRVLTASVRFEEAASECAIAMAINPNDFSAYGRMANISMARGNANEAVELTRKAVLLNPDLPEIHSSLLLHLNYASNQTSESIFRDHVHFNEKFCRNLSGYTESHSNEKVPNRRLRIGYVSGDFLNHSVAYFVEAVLAHSDKRNFEIFAYSTAERTDEVTDRLKRYCDQWRDVADMGGVRFADLIRADAIDILVDVSGHTNKNRLQTFARKPAPIQVTWLGYPNTTGLTSMDYRITDPFAEPVGMTEHLNTETLFRLPEVFCSYTPCASKPERRNSPELSVRSTPALESGFITFGCFNNFAKVSPPTVALWSRILHAIPMSKLMLEAGGLGLPFVRNEVAANFAAHGIHEERLILKERKPEQQYVLYHQIDIALDPFPCNGGTTSFDALWMGVPLITLAGKTFVSRMGVSLLSNLGLQELIAQTPDDYIQIAKDWSANLSQLNALRLALRPRMEQSALMDSKRFMNNLESAYRTMWRTWCESDAQHS